MWRVASESLLMRYPAADLLTFQPLPEDVAAGYEGSGVLSLTILMGVNPCVCKDLPFPNKPRYYSFGGIS